MKSNYNVAFLILHYHTIEETRKSVHSILANMQENNYANYEIVIVDNGSSNRTGAEIQKEFADIRKVAVLINKENLGFSAGNNVGFRYIKRKFNADFIVMMNNDVYLIQRDFLRKVFLEYERSHFAVLGPKIILPPGERPFHRNQLPSKMQLRCEILKLRAKWILNWIDFKEILRSLKAGVKKEKKYTKNVAIQDGGRMENVVIHGACMIFSKEYIDRFDGLDEKTFLYGEEDLLFIKLQENHLKSVCNSELEVFHDEDSATDATTKNRRGKNLFTAKYGIMARKAILDELKKMEVK